ncbi:hypothetical protein J6G99_02635 [bacterium]|nr:hypothetical protein [bacterium]
MQINSITSYSVKPSANLMANRIEQEPQAPQTPNEEQKQTASLYFTGDGKKNAGSAMRYIMIPIAVMGLAGGITSCDKDDSSTYSNVELYGEITGSLRDSVSQKDTINYYHDITYITKYDTITIPDTIKLPPDTIYKVKDDYVRPEPLDSFMNNMKHWDIDKSVDPKDPSSKRNITHFEATRQWEYNSRIIGDADAYNSRRTRLVYDTELLDYTDKHVSYGKMVLRQPPENINVRNADGSRVRNPKGLYLEIYSNPTNKPLADLIDCDLKRRYFVQTVGDKLKVYTPDENGIFIEDGNAEEGYIGDDTILLRNLIGRYDNNSHLSDVVINAVSDESWKNLYVIQKDYVENQGK